jgi:hypothetical protein
LTSFFCICIPFLPVFCLISLGNNSSMILNKSGENEQLCHIPEFRENGFSFSPFSKKCIVHRLFMLKYSPSSFFGALFMKGW